MIAYTNSLRLNNIGTINARSSIRALSNLGRFASAGYTLEFSADGFDATELGVGDLCSIAKICVDAYDSNVR